MTEKGCFASLVYGKYGEATAAFVIPGQAKQSGARPWDPCLNAACRAGRTLPASPPPSGPGSPGLHVAALGSARG